MVRLTAAEAMSKEATRRTYNAILHCIGRVVRDRSESVAKEPIPSRWVQLIKELKESSTKKRAVLSHPTLRQSEIRQSKSASQRGQV
jgi:hypothetical protein